MTTHRRRQAVAGELQVLGALRHQIIGLEEIHQLLEEGREKGGPVAARRRDLAHDRLALALAVRPACGLAVVASRELGHGRQGKLEHRRLRGSVDVQLELGGVLKPAIAHRLAAVTECRLRSVEQERDL